MSPTKRTKTSKRQTNPALFDAATDAHYTGQRPTVEPDEDARGHIFLETDNHLNCLAVDLVSSHRSARGHFDPNAALSGLEQVYADVSDTYTTVYRDGFLEWVTCDFHLRAESIAQSLRLMGAAKAARLVIRAAKVHGLAESKRDHSDCQDDDHNERIGDWEAERLAQLDALFFRLLLSPLVLVGRFVRRVVSGDRGCWELIQTHLSRGKTASDTPANVDTGDIPVEAWPRTVN